MPERAVDYLHRNAMKKKMDFAMTTHSVYAAKINTYYIHKYMYTIHIIT